MGRFMRKLRERAREELDAALERAGSEGLGGDGGRRGMIADQAGAQAKFEAEKPDAMKKNVRMISGCEDTQTSADVSNVQSFSLPDPAGRAGGACTSTLLNILYGTADEAGPVTQSFTEVLERMRDQLRANGYSQVPQLTSLNPMDVTSDFHLVPTEATGTRRAVMIGINYIGHDQGVLSGCHNDVLNMQKYLRDVHDFDDENMHLLLDDGIHRAPTKDNILHAYRQIIADSDDGDVIFLHYSGHGTKVRDTSGDEDDGYDEALVPIDYETNGLLLDDDLFDVLIAPLGAGVSMVSLMDCCHSGTILDLPYVFKPNADGTMPSSMKLDDTIDLDGLIQQFGGQALGLLVKFLTK